jgi:hypothetical protein
MMTLTKNISAHIAWSLIQPVILIQKNPSLPFLVCKHRFCRECIDSMEELQNCPIADCRVTNHGKSLFQLDEKLIKRIIEKSCSEANGEATLNNGVITDDVAGSRRRNQLLTSG